MGGQFGFKGFLPTAIDGSISEFGIILLVGLSLLVLHGQGLLSVIVLVLIRVQRCEDAIPRFHTADFLEASLFKNSNGPSRSYRVSHKSIIIFAAFDVRSTGFVKS